MEARADSDSTSWLRLLLNRHILANSRIFNAHFLWFSNIVGSNAVEIGILECIETQPVRLTNLPVVEECAYTKAGIHSR